mmetsp:Transcript_41487/g.48147  ORF Transcript_41487/g.48147 Transcript_41487/m.48147 type:complete len:96 (+) Transcript_41487:541-828(+)
MKELVLPVLVPAAVEAATREAPVVVVEVEVTGGAGTLLVAKSLTNLQSQAIFCPLAPVSTVFASDPSVVTNSNEGPAVLLACPSCKNDLNFSLEG